MEWAVLLGQTVLVGLLAGWLVLGAWLNLRIPAVNSELVRDIFSMVHVRENYPEIYRHVSRNRVENPRVHRTAFRLIVICECIVALALSVATLMMLGAVIGLTDPTTARTVAILAVTGFTAIWGSFLVGGELFSYWAGAEGTQATHFMMTLWGIATFVALT